MTVGELLDHFMERERFTFIDNKSKIKLVCSVHTLIYGDVLPIWKDILNCEVIEYNNRVVIYER